MKSMRVLSQMLEYRGKKDGGYVPLRASDFTREDRGIPETLMMSAVEEFRALPFHAKRFFKPVLDNLENVYRFVVGASYQWKTQEDERALQRIDE